MDPATWASPMQVRAPQARRRRKPAPPLLKIFACRYRERSWGKRLGAATASGNPTHKRLQCIASRAAADCLLRTPDRSMCPSLCACPMGPSRSRSRQGGRDAREARAGSGGAPRPLPLRGRSALPQGMAATRPASPGIKKQRRNAPRQGPRLLRHEEDELHLPALSGSCAHTDTDTHTCSLSPSFRGRGNSTHTRPSPGAGLLPPEGFGKWPAKASTIQG